MFTSWLRRHVRRVRCPSLRLEILEDRLAPAVATFVDDNWNLIADNGTVGVLDAGDVVRNDNDTINPGTVTATLGTTGFGTVTTSNVGTVTGVPGSVTGAATSNDSITNTDVGGTLTVLEGTYTENVVINKSLTLRSMGGSGLTTITGISNGALGAVLVAANTNNVTIGGTGAGFTINGIDNPNPAIESAAVYLQGNQTSTTIRGNVINANGDEALFSEFIATVSALTVDANTFGGQTFTGTNPAGIGFSAQFTLPNVPRPLVLLGRGSGGGNPSNVTFTNNQIAGTAGGISITDNSGNPAPAHEQGNTLATIDSNGATISGNTFAGTTNRFADSLRARGPNTTISGNTFSSANLTPTTSHVEIANTGQTLDQIAAANTFDKYAFVPGGSTTGQIGTDLQTAINVVPRGTTLQVLGTFPGNVTVDKAITINGNFGATGAVNVTAPGAVINGAVTAGAGLSFVAGSTLVVSLDATPFVSSTVTGAVALNGATLQVNGANPPAQGSTFTLINNDGSDPVTGTFAGLPEGATVVVAGVPLSISYVGGDGNDVTLSAAPVPPSNTLSYAVGAGLGGQGHVKSFNAGAQTASSLTYPGYTGAVRVASADVNGDGAPDFITGTVQGTDHVKVFDGQTGALLFSFLAFGG